MPRKEKVTRVIDGDTLRRQAGSIQYGWPVLLHLKRGREVGQPLQKL